MMHDEERFNDYIQRIAREHESEIEVPREEMWRRIDATRRDRRGQGAGHGVVELASRRRMPVVSWLRWAGALAAMLVLGIAIGRLGPARPAANAPMVAAGDGVASPDAAAMLPYRMAAVQHLDRTEALLASLTVDARAGRTEEVAGWAGDLLTDTRLLLDSPAGDDPDLNKLLVDLELVLAQITDLQAGRADVEVEMIQDGINQRDVLLRLRAATARPDLAGS